MINTDRLVKTFIDLAKIDSPSMHEETIAKELVSRLTALGATVEIDTHNNVLGKLEGSGQPLMLNAHMDTVEPGRGVQPIIKDGKIISDRSTIVGGDDKAGIAIILETLQSITEDKVAHRPLEVLFTVDEEEGSIGAINVDYEKFRAKECLSFDSEGAVASIVITGSAYISVDAKIIGKSAHAGIEPEKGISAIKIAADIITKLPQGRIDEETTCNIGIVRGGSVRNAVPEVATITAEIRSMNAATLAAQIALWKDIFTKAQLDYPDAKIEVSLKETLPRFSIDENEPFLQHVTSLMKSLSLTPQLIKTGGGFDGNFFNQNSIKTAVVGAGSYNAHTTKEYVVVSELVEATTFCEAFVKSIE